MNADQVKTFIRKINGSEHPFIFYDPKSSEWSRLNDFGAWMAPNKTIYLNKEYWSKIGNIKQKCLLLHEMGHLHDLTDYYNDRVERELFAQMWAINKAKELNLFIVYIVSKLFFISWQFYERNSNQSTYVLAYELAKKRNII